MKRKRRMAILTGGGDCPGMNAAIRAVAKKAILEHDMEVVGVEDGYEGLINNRHRKLEYEDVSGILTLGGTMLGTSNTADPFRYAIKKARKLEFKDVSHDVIANIEKLGIDSLVCIGGDGTFSIASRLFSEGVPVVGVPKTIDNDVIGTDITIGFNSAVCTAAEGIDMIHTTAQSHHRIMIVEVMGRNAGWIALHAGVAGGSDVILIPEIPYDINTIVSLVRERNKKGKRYTVVTVAEGAKPEGMDVVIQRIIKESTDPVRLGGIGLVLRSQIEELTGIETRAIVMGHLQRSGPPTAFDRVLATRLGTMAVDLIENEDYGYIVGIKGKSIVKVPMDDVARGQRKVPLNDPLIQSARSVGTCFCE